MEENKETTDWLKKLQKNSWELELFISGGSLLRFLV